VDRQTRATAALHLHRAGRVAVHTRAARDHAYAHGHLSKHRHSRRQHRLVVQRLFRRRHGASDHIELRARPDFRRRRHRAHRIAVVERRVGREDLLSPGCRHQSRHRGSGVELRIDSARAAARHAAAQHHHVQRIDRAGVAAWPLQRYAARTVALRPRQQFHSYPARHGSGRCRAAAVRRQDSSDHGRTRSQGAAGKGPGTDRRGQRSQRTKPDTAGRHREDRLARI